MPRTTTPEVSVTTFSLRTDLKAPLNEAIKGAGLKFVSELLSVIATYPDEAAAALKPLAEKYLAERKSARKTSASEMKKMLAAMTPEELRALVARVESEKKDKATS